MAAHQNSAISLAAIQGERWAPVPDWEGRYEVSSLGRVKKLARNIVRSRNGNPYSATIREIIKQPEVDYRDRWPRVTLVEEGERSGVRRPVARLVVAAFSGPAEAARALDFADGNPENCAFSNILPHEIHSAGEIWRGVLGWEGLYQVSAAGRVRTLGRVIVQTVRGRVYHRFHPARVMKTYRLSAGYPAIVLQGLDRKQRSPIHRLVCEAFHGPRPAGHEVCHKNGDPSDARAANLYWGTKAHNTRDKIITGFAALSGLSVEAVEALILDLRREPR